MGSRVLKQLLYAVFYSRSYFHPREVLIEDSCLSDELRERIKKLTKKGDAEAGDDKDRLLSPTSEREKTKLRILYPFGVSLGRSSETAKAHRG
eukprot:TRINITY_DN2564_c0_g1_i1.p1 TRINITY_DN2564_c0_g1~~TRINITY_DN2564_c0_g1_i1.p1  ORF type:complete len:93 (+),score=32.26 TRINITY_DN2564_c0_g1_i1:283-561(+)